MNKTKIHKFEDYKPWELKTDWHSHYFINGESCRKSVIVKTGEEIYINSK